MSLDKEICICCPGRELILNWNTFFLVTRYRSCGYCVCHSGKDNYYVGRGFSCSLFRSLQETLAMYRNLDDKNPGPFPLRRLTA
jgi:hypothetical protein